MVEFKEFARRFSKLSTFITKQGQKILRENSRELVEMQKEQQIGGVNREGQQIQSGYSTGYAKRRKTRGLQTSFVDLHFSGKMHKGFKVIPVKGGVDIRSREPYEYYVRANFPKAWGLTAQNAEVIANIVAERLAVEIKKYLVA